MAGIVGHAGDILRHIIAAHHVEHEVDALAAGQRQHFGRKILGLVIDRVRRTVCHSRRAFFIAAAGGNRRQPDFLGQLQRGDADAAGAAVDQDRLPRSRPATVHHVGPDGEPGFRQAGGFRHRHPGGHGQALAGRRGAIFGITAARHQRAHRITRPPARYLAAHRHHGTGDFQAYDCRRAGRHRIEAQPLQHIGPVHPGRCHLHQHFARPGLRDGAGDGLQHLRPSRCSGVDGGHMAGYGHGTDIDRAARPVNRSDCVRRSRPAQEEE